LFRPTHYTPQESRTEAKINQIARGDILKLFRKIAVFVIAFTTFAGFGFGYSERPLWPVQGIITQGYGGRYGHTGLDIAAPVGTPVYAALSGRVNYASWNPFGYGNFIKITGNDGREYCYAHNSRLYVRVGQIVHQGQLISRVGSTGHSTGPHLHFEIRIGGNVRSPMAYLPGSRVMLAQYRGRR
jgi:murein DD-endopeptidase MepM/ murein hydrolase activator NlpD